MKARNVSASIYDGGDNTIQIWGVSFSLPGSLPRKDGKIIEDLRRKLEKEIERAIAEAEFNV
jgi:hypothetical protein